MKDVQNNVIVAKTNCAMRRTESVFASRDTRGRDASRVRERRGGRHSCQKSKFTEGCPVGKFGIGCEECECENGGECHPETGE